MIAGVGVVRPGLDGVLERFERVAFFPLPEITEAEHVPGLAETGLGLDDPLAHFGTVTGLARQQVTIAEFRRGEVILRREGERGLEGCDGIAGTIGARVAHAQTGVGEGVAVRAGDRAPEIRDGRIVLLLAGLTVAQHRPADGQPGLEPGDVARGSRAVGEAASPGLDAGERQPRGDQRRLQGDRLAQGCRGLVGPVLGHLDPGEAHPTGGGRVLAGDGGAERRLRLRVEPERQGEQAAQDLQVGFAGVSRRQGPHELQRVVGVAFLQRHDDLPQGRVARDRVGVLEGGLQRGFRPSARVGQLGEQAVHRWRRRRAQTGGGTQPHGEQ